MAMMRLREDEVETFRHDGAVVVKDAVTPEALSALRCQFSRWVDESRDHTVAYGQICDGRQRFDLEDDHTAERPALRPVASPTDFSPDCAAADAAPLSPVAVPSPDAGRIVRGREQGRIRATTFEVETPEIPTGESFFVQQAAAWQDE